MDQLRWTPACSVGNTELDAQHRKMLEICNKIGSHLNDSPESSVFHELLNELVVVTNQHLTSEENIFLKNSYPDFPAHKAEHDKQREETTELLWLAIQHKLDFKTLHSFVYNWWENHVMKSDLNAKEYLK